MKKKPPTACPYCAHEAPHIFGAKDVNNWTSNATFDYYRCSACGIVFLASPPDDLGRYYKSGYRPYVRPTSKEELIECLERVEFRLDIVRQFKTAGRLLEIGPSFGAFALLAKNAGFHVDAIEMDSACCEFLSAELGILAYNSASVVETLRSLGLYDVITFWQSVEHLPAPWEVLTEAFSHLSPDGIVVVATPNPNALQFRVLRTWWTHLDAPRHQFLLPTRFLRTLCESHRLREVHFTASDPDSREITKWGWAGSFVARANGNGPLVLLGRFVGVVVALLTAVFERGPRSAAYTVVYQKHR